MLVESTVVHGGSAVRRARVSVYMCARADGVAAERQSREARAPVQEGMMVLKGHGVVLSSMRAYLFGMWFPLDRECKVMFILTCYVYSDMFAAMFLSVCLLT